MSNKVDGLRQDQELRAGLIEKTHASSTMTIVAQLLQVVPRR